MKRLAVVAAAVLGVLVVLGGLAWAVPVFSVRQFAVTGTDRLAEEEVVAATGVAQGDNLVRVDTGAAAAGVAGLDWVRRASVSRSWPSTLRVEVTERTAVLRLGDKLVDDEGVTFTADNPPEKLLEAAGRAAADPAVARAAAALDPASREAMERVEADDVEEITFRTRDGREIYWGSADDAHDKALATATVLGREGGHWDVSNPQLVTVR